jgi:Flp pilus assembly protein TadG
MSSAHGGARSKRDGQSGAALAELAVLLPVVIITLLAVIDFGRLVYCHQVATDLTREAANLVSRGTATSEAWSAAAQADGPIQLDENGEMIVSVIRRKSSTDSTPWIFEQTSNGPLNSVKSRVGSLNQKAKIPHITTMGTGVTITAVEIYHGFQPIFSSGDLALTIYPEFVYGAAFF